MDRENAENLGYILAMIETLFLLLCLPFSCLYLYFAVGIVSLESVNSKEEGESQEMVQGGIIIYRRLEALKWRCRKVVWEWQGAVEWWSCKESPGLLGLVSCRKQLCRNKVVNCIYNGSIFLEFLVLFLPWDWFVSGSQELGVCYCHWISAFHLCLSALLPNSPKIKPDVGCCC